jgi:drug/metabolite transporter (DMT)-like permease
VAGGGLQETSLADTASLLALLGLVLFPTLLGHTAANNAVRHFSPLTVSFFTLLEPVLATVIAALLLGELPAAAQVPAYLLFIAAAVLALLV